MWRTSSSMGMLSLHFDSRAATFCGFCDYMRPRFAAFIRCLEPDLGSNDYPHPRDPVCAQANIKRKKRLNDVRRGIGRGPDMDRHGECPKVVGRILS